MMNPIKLSLVIPVYNEEKHIGKCLESCVKQNLPYNEYEIIVVNNGSTDSSLSIIEAYAAKYPHIRVHTQENKIAGGARNYGILNAKGEYIWFIDGDDWIEENCLSALTGFTEDIVLFPGYYRWIDGEVTTITAPTPEFDKIAETVIDVIPFVTLHRRDFLLKKQLLHLENVYCEDREFAPKVYCCAENINYINKIVYYYRLNRDSVTQSITPKKCNDMLVLAVALLSNKKYYATNNKWDSFFDTYILSALHEFSHMSIFLSSKDRQMQYASFRKESDLQQILIHTGKLGNKIKIYLLNRSYYLFDLYLRFELKWIMPLKQFIKISNNK